MYEDDEIPDHYYLAEIMKYVNEGKTTYKNIATAIKLSLEEEEDESSS